MKNAGKCFLLLALFATYFAPVAFAGSVVTNEWGVAACGVQMSLVLKNTNKDFKTNDSINLVVRLKNVSDDTVYVVRTDPLTDFSFVVISPSGKNISPRQASANDNPIIQRQSSPLKPNEFFVFPEIDLHSVCEFREEGVYEVTVKRRFPFPYIRNGCEVVSNPIKIPLSTLLTNEIKSSTSSLEKKNLR